MRVLLLGLSILVLGSCASPWPAFRDPVFIGIEPMGDAAAQNSLLTAFAAGRQVRVVDLSDARNAWAFDALPATKLRLSTRIETGLLCLSSRYAVWTDGRFEYSSGLVIPSAETDGRAETCLALLASRLRGDLLRQRP